MQVIRLTLSLAAAGLASSRSLPTLNDGGLSAGPSTNGTADRVLDRRDNLQTDAGVIAGTRHDSLYTNGLATCVGMAARGVPRNNADNAIDKVLSHVRCANYYQHILDYKYKMYDADLDAPLQAVSVVNPDLIDPALRDTQKNINREALLAANSLSGGIHWTVKVVERQSTEGALPLGSVQIDQNQHISAEGQSVEWPVGNTLDISCWWPMRYTPVHADPEDVRAMTALANAICASGNGCTSGTPTCTADNARPLGFCYCA